jgi:CRP-like cAMP-binding protein
VWASWKARSDCLEKVFFYGVVVCLIGFCSFVVLAGDYFGEIALLTDSPRQATCVAVGKVKCVYMQREDFVRVMGPLQDKVNEKIPLYKKFLGPNNEKGLDND